MRLHKAKKSFADSHKALEAERSKGIGKIQCPRSFASQPLESYKRLAEGVRAVEALQHTYLQRGGSRKEDIARKVCAVRTRARHAYSLTARPTWQRHPY